MAGKTDLLGASSSRALKSLQRFALGVAAAGATVAAVSVKMAGDFQTQMERLHTQANVSTKNMDLLSAGILRMAGSVAETPQVLAQAAYHIASVGQHSLTTAQQLAVLRVASEGAKMGGADLTDVTNALDAALVAHLEGVKNYSQAMGVLNATVGAGDMTMQDLADAFGPLGATFKGFGVSIQQAGAALATFGDNNLRGAMAGSQLRQSITALAHPLSAGVTQLQAWGIQQGNLSAQLKQGGLTDALQTLADKLHGAGYTAKTMGPVLAEMFGKRGPQQGLSILINELDRYEGKLREVSHGGRNFASDWTSYTKTFGYAWDSARSAVQSVIIQLGERLLPVATKVFRWIGTDGVRYLDDFGSWAKRSKGWLVPLTESLAGLTAAFVGLRAVTRVSTVIGGALQSLAGRGPAGGVMASLRTQPVFVTNWPVGLAGAGAAGGVAAAEGGAAAAGGVSAATVIAPVVAAAVLGLMVHGAHADNVAAQLNLQGAGSDSITKGLQASRELVGKQKVIFEQGWKQISAIIRNAIANPQDANAVNAATTAIWGLDKAARSTGNSTKAGKQAFQQWEASLANMAQNFGPIGKMIDDGLASGLRDNASEVAVAASYVMHQGVISTLLREGKMSSPSKRTYEMGRWLAEGLVNGFKDESEKVRLEMSDSLRGVLDRIRTDISNAQKRIDAQVKAAQASLRQVEQARRQFIASQKQSLMGSADLSGLFTTTSTGATVMGTTLQALLGTDAAKMKMFAAAIGQLAKRHLAPGLLTQIEDLGPDQGMQVAQQILSGLDGSISGLNATWAQLNMAAGQAATVVGNRAYAGQVGHAQHVLHRERHRAHMEERRIEHLAHRMALEFAEQLKPEFRKIGSGKDVHLELKGYSGSLPHDFILIIDKGLRNLNRHRGKG